MWRVFFISLGFLLALEGIGVSSGQQRKAEKATSTVEKSEASPEAQKPPPDSGDIVHKQALFLLDQLFDQAKDLEDSVTRIRLQASIADTLWLYDENRARDQFNYAFNAIGSVKRGTPDSFGNIDRLTDPQFQLRQDVIKLVNRHDKTFGKKLMDSVIEPSKVKKPGATSAGLDGGDRAAILVRLASESVDEDLPTAGEYLMESLNYGIPSQFMWVLLRIRARDGVLADQIFVRALQYAGSHIDSNLMIFKGLAIYALPDYAKGSLSSGNAFDLEFMDLVYQSRPSQTNLFLEFVYKSIIQNPGPTGDTSNEGTIINTVRYMNLVTFLPYFEQYYPDSAPAIREQLSAAGQGMPPAVLKIREDFVGPRTVDSMVKSGDDRLNKDPDGSDIDYYGAAILAAREGDIDRALIIIDKTKNQARRDAAKEFFTVEAILFALKQQDPDKAKKLSKGLSNPVLESMGLYQIGNYWLKKGDSVRAKDFFEDATKRINSADASPERGRASLVIISGMTKVDLIRGFELLKDAIHLINQDDSKPPETVNKQKIYDVKPQDRNGVFVWDKKQKSYERSGIGTTSLDDCLSLLARADYYQALLLAQTLENKTTQLKAELAVCSGALKKTEMNPKKGE